MSDGNMVYGAEGGWYGNIYTSIDPLFESTIVRDYEIIVYFRVGIHIQNRLVSNKTFTLSIESGAPIAATHSQIPFYGIDLSYGTWNWNFWWRDITVGISCPRKETNYGFNISSKFITPWGTSIATRAVLVVPALEAAHVPGAPSISGSGNSRSISCPAVSGGVSYKLYSQLYNTNSTLGTRVLLNGAASTNPVVYNLSANSAYYFTYSAIGRDGVERFGTSSGPHYTIPTSPSNLTAATSNQSVNLSWSTNAAWATSLQIQRANNTSFSGATTIYNGAKKSTHADNPPMGLNYYRVTVTGPSPYAQSTWSNVASAQTMSLPASVTNLTRLNPHDSNTIKLSWTNNPTTAAPYSTIEVEVTENPSKKVQTLTLSGSDTSIEILSSTDSMVSVRVRVKNAAGYSAWVSLDYLYTMLPKMELFASSISVESGFATVSLAWDLAEMQIVTFMNSSSDIAYKYSTDDGDTWSSWINVAGSWELGPHESNKIQLPMKEKCLVELTIDTTISGFAFPMMIDPGPRKAPQLSVGPLDISYVLGDFSLAYDKETHTVSIELDSDIWASVVNRDIVLYIDGVPYTSWYADENDKSIIQAIIPPASRFVVAVEVSSPLAKEPVIKQLTIDCDTTRLRINNRRYLAALIYSNSQREECSINLIR